MLGLTRVSCEIYFNVLFVSLPYGTKMYTYAYTVRHNFEKYTGSTVFLGVVIRRTIGLNGLMAPRNWRRRPGRPRHTWLRTVEEDLRQFNLQ